MPWTIEHRDGVAIVTMNTNKANAQNPSFFRDLHNHLAPGGRVLLFFGTSGDMDFLTQLIAASGFHAEVVKSRRLHKDGWQIEYVTQRLTVAP